MGGGGKGFGMKGGKLVGSSLRPTAHGEKGMSSVRQAQELEDLREVMSDLPGCHDSPSKRIVVSLCRWRGESEPNVERNDLGMISQMIIILID